MVPPQSFEPEVEAVTGPPPRNLPATAEQLLARRSTIAAGWVVLALVVIGLAAVAFVGRNQIVAFWPPAIQLYDTLGIEVAEGHPERLFGAGLSVRNVASEVVEEDGGDAATIIIRGEVVNESDVPRPVPPLMVRLVDDSGEALHAWVFAITDAPLQPGETEAFETSLSEFDRAVTKLEILPAPGEDELDSTSESASEPPDAGAGDDPAEHSGGRPTSHPVSGTDAATGDDPGHGTDQATVPTGGAPGEDPDRPPQRYPQAREFE